MASGQAKGSSPDFTGKTTEKWLGAKEVHLKHKAKLKT